MYLSVEDQRGSIRLLVENENYQISGSLREPVVNSSGPAQQQLNEYDKELRLYNAEISELYQKYRLAMQENDESKTDSLIALLEGMDSKINAYDSLYILNNPASPTAVIALRNIFYRYD
ncbi:MAG TPA: hypothetical protein ENN61_05530, partial [Bacteroidaceae bacterium]|nr:hypothetical protein [Bacteroidaceae bacterium]